MIVRLLTFVIDYRPWVLLLALFGVLDGVVLTIESTEQDGKVVKYVNVGFYFLLSSFAFLALYLLTVVPVILALIVWLFAPGTGQTIALIAKKQPHKISAFSYIMTVLFASFLYIAILGRII